MPNLTFMNTQKFIKVLVTVEWHEIHLLISCLVTINYLIHWKCVQSIIFYTIIINFDYVNKNLETFVEINKHKPAQTTENKKTIIKN